MIGHFLKCLAGAAVILVFASVASLVAVESNDYNPELQVQPKSVKFKTAVMLGVAESLAEPPYGISETALARKANGLRRVFVSPPA